VAPCGATLQATSLLPGRGSWETNRASSSKQQASSTLE